MMRDVSIGESVNATIPEMTTDAAKVNANSVNKDPVTPETKPIGK